MTDHAVDAAPQARFPQQVWDRLGPAERERAYDNLGGTPGSAAWTRDRDRAAAAFRASRPGALDLRYGAGPRGLIDLYPAARAEAPCLVFIHGGYWMRNSRETFAHYAQGLLAAGWSVAMPGYTLAPDASLTAIAAEIGAALDWLAAEGPARGVAGPVVLAGWSAGAHLAALHLDHPLVAAGLAISGVFDLAPLKDLAMNAALRLTGEEVAALSPLTRPLSPKPLALAYGTAELPALQYETLRFRRAGRRGSAGRARRRSGREPLHDPRWPARARRRARRRRDAGPPGVTSRIPGVSGPHLGAACLLVAAVGWGLNWIAVKSLVPVMPPLLTRGSAGLAAAVLLAGVAWARREPLAVPRNARARLALAAFTNVFAWMGFSAVSIVWLRVAEAALLVYTMPIWATALSWAITGARPRPRTLLALAIGVGGIVTLLSGSPMSFGGEKLPGVLFALAAAILFAIGALTTPGGLGLPPIAGTAWQLALGCGPLVAASLLFETRPEAAFGPSAWLAWGYMALGPMAVCYFAWFAALRRLSADVAATGMLLAPAVAALASSPLLGEPLTLRDGLAFALVMTGVALALRNPPARAGETALVGEIPSSGN